MQNQSLTMLLEQGHFAALADIGGRASWSEAPIYTYIKAGKCVV
jgi:hypothetical protein